MRSVEELAVKQSFEEDIMPPILKRQIKGFAYLAGLLLEENVNVNALEPIEVDLPLRFLETGTIQQQLKMFLQCRNPRRGKHNLPRELYMSWLQDENKEFFKKLTKYQEKTLRFHMKNKMAYRREAV
ncbi:hypothetical protein CROQUDRAFT_726399 [Cronartium quercuum f. sp. fusiforme G11]|uniref:Uncharacterized protein n=1 Tax=Cronartium quercuum f. sp. fusiforme G11 TaxID=708437 RepID=A0A9P6N5R5_9BASI|nr:hypothetical protein CROQUDRAFT_726399 [Cronartium quercuum f. sp. fusiforme G11]